ncbi:hybrid-cluster NAD(P)-dependent oxidoreductase [Rhodococcus sp. BP-149]|uniref:hybrid-cluster NAD(P)-dependent oxidoreductase n=1 Tax=unclassified Rhodococcus (in: high G+C Gram-positive bacteria) TaxID=192944 RepID=UPI001C9BB094|nr:MULTISPECIES: hybrid-cluster NAD(P)-dependent oxidoreductase [unclassified Rhodococcus (in: high G+C Gram-positive bacteria)]MBY6685682.1 hybrid-cluster NAD(P)-dependent oxidoreductase [Rhodococcus sp. BP-288]MBY6694770.1 hybrid-cluster NAD(P)-dependent oxidoreductase [Rhodococcus sp. BP-188]MBY6696616.1 hybrid-cluster NAD(P)-dependent oxidoreductase [Rhodococcus sp. BP-285]MBY6703272.1 hybrid-cluster NAD(P)-dependent oxidoreductase [Rhodococcus sp. BP-283]MBY6708595.1 hybrid-cluster NAD(P)
MSIDELLAPPAAPTEPCGGLAERGLVLPDHSPDCWERADEVVLRCRAVREITHDVRSFVFEPVDGSVFRFAAGQFVTLRAEIDGDTVYRCYTVSSPPTRPYHLTITVKRVLGGPVSNWLHDTMEPGREVAVLAPLGAFTLGMAKTLPDRYVFLSAGSGITPMMSMTRTLFDVGSDADIVFVHSARTPADIIFRRELDAMESAMPNLRVTHVCENDYPSDRWSGLRGRLTSAMLSSLVPDLADRVAFTCGPPAYMSSVRRLLDDLSFDMDRYFEESFSFDSLPAPDREAVHELEQEVDDTGSGDAGPDEVSAPATFTVNFATSGRSITCSADQNVLEAALAAGMRLPSSCGEGVCGTCKTTLTAGEVDMRHNGGIRPKEIARGKVLICCSRPLTDLTIES